MYRNIQDVTGNPNNLAIIKDLIRIQRRYKEPIEMIYLEPCPKVIYQQCIIDHVQRKHRLCEISILIDPKQLEVYKFIYKTDIRLSTFQFSNNMKVGDDVLIMCYLHYVLSRRCPYAECEIIKALITLIKNKYNISVITTCRLNLDSICLRDLENITTFMIFLSFPSVSLAIFYYISTSPALLSFLTIPKIMYAPTTVLVLPKSAQNPPFAILMAIFVKSEHLLKSKSSQTSLTTFYQYIVACYNCEFLPERLKLDICRKWNIVIKTRETYKFISTLTVYRQKAKTLISELRPNDPDLEDILSKI